jgi:phage terminase large subunit-like protein
MRRTARSTRAEPVAALCEQGKVHHVGFFTELEDQQCSYVAGEGASPDRYDALVWALTELGIKDEPGLLRMYREELARRQAQH